MIFFSEELIIPQYLWKHATELAYEGQGLVKTKALLTEKIWFARTETLTKRHKKSYTMHQAAMPQDHSATLNVPPLSSSPRMEVSVGFGYLLNVRHLLVTDNYSQYPDVKIEISQLLWQLLQSPNRIQFLDAIWRNSCCEITHLCLLNFQPVLDSNLGKSHHAGHKRFMRTLIKFYMLLQEKELIWNII